MESFLFISYLLVVGIVGAGVVVGTGKYRKHFEIKGCASSIYLYIYIYISIYIYIYLYLYIYMCVSIFVKQMQIYIIYKCIVAL